MKKQAKSTLLPASLLVFTVTGCPAPTPDPVCSPAQDACLPDGGFICGSDCSAARNADGGVFQFPDGGYECFC